MNDLLVLVIVVAVVANIALMAGAVVYARTRRTPDDVRADFVAPALTPGAGLPTSTVPEPAPGPEPSVLPPAPEPSVPPAAPESPISAVEDRAGAAATIAADVAMPTLSEVVADEPVDDLTTFLDPVTGMATAAGWDHVVVLEERRHGRYGRPATVVVLELDRIDALAERFGAETADRLIPAVADAIRRSSRTADVIARTDHATFRILMPETDEIRAINLVERLRETCDTWLEASAVAVRLAIGWASAGPNADLRTAQRVATERMYADRSRGRAAPGRP
ncbi:MAG TPA: diguanylate cyclase [Candidatus Limnocylindrales bacterium]|nr:diguanylate cyclase [Candidatus Limnocylindrales bacterium]